MLPVHGGRNANRGPTYSNPSSQLKTCDFAAGWMAAAAALGAATLLWSDAVTEFLDTSTY